MNQLFDRPVGHDRVIQQTTLESWSRIQPKIGRRQQQVYSALKELCRKYGNATDSEIAHHLGQGDPNYVRPRRFELAHMVNEPDCLVNLNPIVLACIRPCKITGRKAMAWKCGESG